MNVRTESIAITAGETLISQGRSPRGRLEWTDRLLLYGLVALLTFGVMAFGAVEPWSIFAFEAGALALFIAWALKHAFHEKLSFAWNPLYPALAIIAVAVGVELLFRLTAYRDATLQEALKYVAYAFLIIVANDCFRHSALVRRFGMLLAFFGFVIGGTAFAQDALHSQKLLFLLTPIETGSSYGSYVNHAHYAGLMEMLAPFPLTLAMAPYLRGRTRALLGAAAAVMVATVFLCGSRGGLIAFFAQAAFLALVFARGRQHRRKIAITAFVVFISMAALFASGKGAALERLSTLRDPLKHDIGGLRKSVLKDSRAMLAERPVLGWGLGTFQYVYPQFRSFYTNSAVAHAHNDYLELLLETGAIGFTGVLWFVVVLLYSGWTKLPQWKTGLTGTVKIGAMAGCVGILTHSLIDFNLQITANAALFYVLSTMATGSQTESADR